MAAENTPTLSSEEIARITREEIANALKEESDRKAAIETARAQRETEDRTLVEETTRRLAREFAKSRRLPTGDAGQAQGAGNGQAPYVTGFSELRKYDGLDVADMAFLCGTLDAAKHANRSPAGMPDTAAKALAIKIAEDKGPLGEQARNDLNAAGLHPVAVLNDHAAKANELDYSTQAGFGDERVGAEYSRRLWAPIRSQSTIVAKIPTVEVPQGTESILIPLEGADPTWYKVAQTTATNATTLRPDATIPTSKLAT